jgi:hypothetical protein
VNGFRPGIERPVTVCGPAVGGLGGVTPLWDDVHWLFARASTERRPGAIRGAFGVSAQQSYREDTAMAAPRRIVAAGAAIVAAAFTLPSVDPRDPDVFTFHQHVVRVDVPAHVLP